MQENPDAIRIPPEPPYPPTPPPPRGTSRTTIIAVVAAIIAAVAAVFILPLIFGSNPVDMLSGKETVTTEEVRTVEERVVKAGQEAVVEAANKVLPSVVYIEVDYGGYAAGIGSGFIYGSDGYIVTNNHVVQDASRITVALGDGSSYQAELVGTDPEMDLAVVKIDESDLPAAELGTSSDLVVGELAVAVGSPEGFEQSVTSGIISALNRNLPLFHPDNAPETTPLLDVIQTDAAINPGNSGGPLCNSVGDVIGINTAIYSLSGGYDGLSFAIAIDNAKPVIEELIDKGFATHPWLGFYGTTLEPEVAERFELPVEKGAIIRRVVQDAPAEKAGLEAGDIIVVIDGDTVESMDEVMLQLRNHQVGDTITVEYYRGQEKLQATAVLEEKI
ncbi:MAG: trypsin-like peptidase domain-containing protein [Actinomycetota bacterium]|nr:trypsin-like peptidase domain-containing protein [Actinomycetota bacterium]